jgi:hypothetical protein
VADPPTWRPATDGRGSRKGYYRSTGSLTALPHSVHDPS